MTVLFYGPNQHPAGFVGYRVARTLGTGEYRQRYFSLNRYDHDEARRLAHDLDRTWADIARRRQAGPLAIFPDPSRPHIVAQGLRAILYHTGRNIITPGFLAIACGAGAPHRFLSIKRHGYIQAFQMAVDAYARLRPVSDADLRRLRQSCPDPAVFRRLAERSAATRDRRIRGRTLDAIDFAMENLRAT